MVRLVRKPSAERDTIFWDPECGVISLALLEGFHAVINLAGSSIGKGRWSKARKKELFQSRARYTWLLAHCLSRLQRPPPLFISASAIGFYGDRGESLLTETSVCGEGFLADLCRAWESASMILENLGTRVVHARLAPVLTPKGGMLRSLLPLFRLGLGFTLGKGDQWMSWIALSDAVAAFYHLMMREELKGAVNLTAPQNIRNKDFAKFLANQCRRPLLFRIPSSILRMALGEMAENMLASCRVVPEKLNESGFVFQAPEITSAF